MKNDLSKPLIVILGHWNPAILEVGWVLKNLFEFGEGTTVEINKLVDGYSQNEIYFIEGIGYSCQPDKISFYVDSDTAEAKEKCRQVALKTLQVLEHTPTGAFGINFKFVQEDPDVDLSDQLAVNDRLDEMFSILNTNVSTTIQYNTDVLLYFSRGCSEKIAYFDFNFHHNEISLFKNSPDLISDYYKYAKEFVEQHYNVALDGSIEFNLAE